MDAATLREKSEYFDRLLTNNWNHSVEIQLTAHIELCDFEVFRDWLDGRQPRWFKHYMHEPGEGPLSEVVFDARDQWPSTLDFHVDSRKSRYCHHLCQLWVLGAYFGEEFQRVVMERLRKITMDEPPFPSRAKRAVTVDEPDWTSAFVLSPETLRLVYDSTDEDYWSPGPLREWAADVVASRLNISQLFVLSENALPNGYLNAVYQKKFWLEAQAHRRELDKLRDEIQGLHVELNCRDDNERQMSREIDLAEIRAEELLRAGYTPKAH